MKSRTLPSFWEGYARLPARVQELADKQYRLWLKDPHHPSVRFKKVGQNWSARVTEKYRAVGVLCEDEILWYFIRTHTEYDRILR